ncbi:hypothetical protein RRG08_000823 [Elysia crispata]|uniref:Uncharacterized protein n=1 Tax=Elysia crispata TaxID=231223 RepID=A0AAE0ZZQ6_9GAST|nr:hypothetical protein RRG08_000823 [Elysia crispata]
MLDRAAIDGLRYEWNAGSCGYPRLAVQLEWECWSVRLSPTCDEDAGACDYPRLAVQIECWSVRLSPTCGTDRMLERATILDLRYR